MPWEEKEVLTDIEPKYWRRYFSPQVLTAPSGRLASQRRMLKILAVLAGGGGLLLLLGMLYLALIPLSGA